MEREVGINAVEKKRLRDAIEDQVRQYLERGGSITVIQTPTSAASRATHGGVWASGGENSSDFMAQLD